MIEVSSSFDVNMSLNTRPQIFAEVEFRQLADGADESASFTASGQSSVSRLPQLANGVQQIPNYARLEYGGWPLDGTMPIQPDNMTGQVGAWSEAVTDESGILTNPMVVTATLSETITSVGLSFYFDTAQGTYPPEFTVAAYNGETLVDTIQAMADGPICALEHPINDYNRLVLTFGGMNLPYTRVRLTQIVFGIVRIFGNKELVEFSVLRQVDPVNTNNQASELQFAFDNRDGKFDFENPSGIFDYLTTRMEALPRIGLKGELISLGKYYLSDWSADQRTGKTSLQAQDAFSLLDGSFSGYFENTTLMVIAESALSGAGISNYRLDSALDVIAVTADVGDSTRRQVLSWIAASACLTLYVSLDGIVSIGSLPSAESLYTITYRDSQKPVGSMGQPLKSISIKYGTGKDPFGNDIDLTVSQTYADSGQEINITDNPFITTQDRASAVLIWLAEYYQRRKNYQNDWRQNPKVDIGDIIRIQTNYGMPNAQVLSQKFTFSGGGLSGQTESKGI